jgi:tagaturonate reductase
LPHHLLFSLSALIHFYKGTWKGKSLPVNDSPVVSAFFAKTWQSHNLNEVATQVLSQEELWGKDLTQSEGLTQQVIDGLNYWKKAEQGEVHAIPAF